MEFTTRYTCPTRLVGGGGEGTYGLCAVEMLSVMTGDLNPSNGKPTDRHMAINGDLRNMTTVINDYMSAYVSAEVRTESLWPILPAILDTAGKPFPSVFYRQYLGFENKGDNFHPADYMTLRAGEDVELLRSDRDLWATFTPESVEARYKAAVEAFKTGIALFHEVNGTTPLDDYKLEHIEKLSAYLAKQEGNEFLAPLGV